MVLNNELCMAGQLGCGLKKNGNTIKYNVYVRTLILP